VNRPRDDRSLTQENGDPSSCAEIQVKDKREI
jgi:hypothetical protein